MNQTGTSDSSSAKPLLAALAILAALILAYVFDAQSLLRQALDWIAGLGIWGAVIFVVLYVIVTVLFLPGSILTLGAGLVFGVIRGTIIVSIASTLGATCAFLIGRYFARDWVAGKIEGNENFAAIDRAVAGEGWKIVGLTRLSPVFPFNLLNYAFALTGVSLRDFFFASWIGMFPGTVMFVYIGSLAGDLATLGTSERARTPAEWALYVGGLLATVAVTFFVTKLARAALAKQVEQSPETAASAD